MITMLPARFFPLVMAAVLAGCSRPLPPAGYRAYLEDPANDLTQTQEKDGIIVTCSYRPTPLLVLQDFTQASESETSSSRDSLARAYAGKTYCAVSFSRGGSEIENAFVTDPLAYQQALAYLNNGIAADCYLATAAHDSVPALASMYLRQYGATGRSTVLLVFNTHQLQPEDGFHLTLRAQRLGLGSIRFPFTARALAALPALQMD